MSSNLKWGRIEDEDNDDLLELIESLQSFDYPHTAQVALYWFMMALRHKSV